MKKWESRGSGNHVVIYVILNKETGPFSDTRDTTLEKYLLFVNNFEAFNRTKYGQISPRALLPLPGTERGVDIVKNIRRAILHTTLEKHLLFVGDFEAFNRIRYS
jgi:hypothetical protein